VRGEGGHPFLWDGFGVNPLDETVGDVKNKSGPPGGVKCGSGLFLKHEQSDEDWGSPAQVLNRRMEESGDAQLRGGWLAA